MFRLEDHICLITGCGSPAGIGFAAAKQLGEQGATVLLVATTGRIYERVRQLERAGIRAEGYICNLLKRDEVEQLVSKVIKKYGKIDVLVNNAGIGSTAEQMQNHGNKTHPMFYELSDDAWESGIQKNLTITYNITRRVLPYMIERNYGRIVHVSSVTGPVVTQKGLSAYSAAKAAVIGMSKAIAVENGKNGITSNCVLPGWVDTGVLSGAGLEASENTPVGRAGFPEEIAAGITFLAMPEASYITGQELIIDGGNVLQEIKGGQEVY
ncbi:MAG: SDR family NAD(P)-dependent oxidoreductase [Eubacteriales bacterium]|nr:SDR family NAD(P)-dependent oxidoreductase [Eubacteriales bacterium]